MGNKDLADTIKELEEKLDKTILTAEAVLDDYIGGVLRGDYDKIMPKPPMPPKE